MPNIINEIKLDFKDVLLRPKRSTLKTRAQVSVLSSNRARGGVPVFSNQSIVKRKLQMSRRHRSVKKRLVRLAGGTRAGGRARDQDGSFEIPTSLPTAIRERTRLRNVRFSRSIFLPFQVDLFRNITFRNSKRTYKGIPLMASNMDTVGTFEMAAALGKVSDGNVFPGDSKI